MANQADFNVRTMCRVLKVSASGYYAWRDRAPSLRRIANAVLMERIREIHRESGESYGMPRVRAELLEQGHCASRKRVARLMRLEVSAASAADGGSSSHPRGPPSEAGTGSGQPQVCG